MAPKKVVLPPRPSSRKAAAASPAYKAADPRDIKDRKAVAYIIRLDDGTSLQAHGEHADLIYRYLNECETRCAEHQMVNFLAPGFTRYDADGKAMATGEKLKYAIQL